METLFGWVDWELLGRLEELIWRFFNRLVNIDWSVWPDEKIVGLAIMMLIFVCIGFYLLSRVLWALQWVLLAALIVAVFIGVGLTLPGAPSQVQWSVALLVALALVLLVLWLLFGREGWMALRFRLIERIFGPETVLLAFGLEEEATPEEVAPEKEGD